MAQIVDKMRFWGIALAAAVIALLANYVRGIWSMSMSAAAQSDDEGISGETFLQWAQAAESAMVPSVSFLCEEMAHQRRHQYKEGDTRETTAMRREEYIGSNAYSADAIVRNELADREIEERVDHAELVYLLVLLIFKLLLGNCLQLWLQASFFALTFDETGVEAKCKVLASMSISGLQALVRARKIRRSKIGPVSGIVTTAIVGLIVWTVAKVTFAYKCEDHLWNLTTGCVRLPESLRYHPPAQAAVSP
jgi:hypothetical protein